ncbi:cyclopropane-fatty-acyl-phospholipid synthase family protein [Brevundimonas sp.]|uniref:cyclopropane-fatty-acyl-phospholipid synthase family protein n=1 Tax=Brevundimonas sp. TaxID=1871086 RepID=UPI002D1FBF1D|nr:cyclopropane-fatty-acyl-phospholipid synthase family protein [Brevundimonas sp.]
MTARNRPSGDSLVPAVGPRTRSQPPRLFLAALRAVGRDWKNGTFEILYPNGSSDQFGVRGSGPSAQLVVHDWAFADRVMSAGDIGLAESYIAGEWETPHLADLLTTLASNFDRLKGLARGAPVIRAVNWLRHSLFRRNSPRQAQRNIHAHYDLGNDFYRWWLDPTMSYSSALFLKEQDTLWFAQMNKYAALCEAMDLQPGQSVLEIGCGWGGFAEHAALRHDARVTGLTISHEQLDWSKKRMVMQEVDDKVDILFQDYRDATGTFDRIASIEMFEAVGEEYWPDYFRTIRERLAADGKAALQIITIDDQFFDRYRKRVDFIQQHIFPGGMLISEPRLAQEVERAGLKITSIRRFGLDYARTLAEWARTFEMNWGELRRQGFDEEFRRLWRFYLAYCEAGFRTGRTNVIQVALEPA